MLEVTFNLKELCRTGLYWDSMHMFPSVPGTSKTAPVSVEQIHAKIAEKLFELIGTGWAALTASAPKKNGNLFLSAAQCKPEVVPKFIQLPITSKNFYTDMPRVLEK